MVRLLGHHWQCRLLTRGILRALPLVVAVLPDDKVYPHLGRIKMFLV